MVPLTVETGSGAANDVGADRGLSHNQRSWPHIEEDQGMRIYIFKSETRIGLRAFAGDPMGSKLPQDHGPWTATGVVAVDRAPPHNFPRNAIEQAIDNAGFQLWRFRSDRDEKSADRRKRG